VNILKRIVQPVQPRAADPLKRAGLRPGLYHYQRDSGEGTFTRFHLRVDPDGNGVLLANATAAARLRPAGVIVAKGLLDGQSPERIVGQLQHVFRAFSRRQAEADIERVGRLIAELDSPGDNYPILNLDDPAFAGDVPPLEKPLAADLPLCAPERLETLARRLWDLGIPQARFLAGEVLDAAVAVRAVELAEDLGMIAGLRACAGALDQGNLIADLAQAGVDHLDIRCFALVESVHDALAGAGEFGRLRRVIEAIHRCEVCPVAVMPLVRQTVDSIEESIEAAAQMRLGALALFAVATTEPDESGGPLYADELFQVARLIEEAADELGVRLLCRWFGLCGAGACFAGGQSACAGLGRDRRQRGVSPLPASGANRGPLRAVPGVDLPPPGLSAQSCPLGRAAGGCGAVVSYCVVMCAWCARVVRPYWVRIQAAL